MKIKKLFNFKYPKIVILILMIVLAYLVFRNPSIQQTISHLGNFGYLSIFIAGIFFAFGFTAPFSVGFFISLNPSNIWIAGIIGGLGALFADLLIFSTIRISFEREFKRLKNSKYFKKITGLINRNISHKIKIYLMYAFAGILIASPLPDEAGVTMLAGLTKISTRSLAIISLILNTLGIIILLLL